MVDELRGYWGRDRTRPPVVEQKVSEKELRVGVQQQLHQRVKKKKLRQDLGKRGGTGQKNPGTDSVNRCGPTN